MLSLLLLKHFGLLYINIYMGFNRFIYGLLAAHGLYNLVKIVTSLSLQNTILTKRSESTHIDSSNGQRTSR